MRTGLLITIFSLALTAQAADITFAWDYNYAIPACSATVTADCISGFRLYDTTVTPRVLLATVPNPANASGAMTGIEHTVTGYNHLGNSTAVATATFIDRSGGTGESGDSNVATFQVKPGAPSALMVR